MLTWILRRARLESQNSDPVVKAFATFTNYSHALYREMRRWNPDIAIKPKDLRNTIQTASIDGSWYGYYVQRYVGHAPNSIGERHYHGDKGKRLIQLYRIHVVAHIEEELGNCEVLSDSPIFPQSLVHNKMKKLHDHCTMNLFKENSVANFLIESDGSQVKS